MNGSTGNVLRRAFDVAPALSKGLWLTLMLAVLGTALQLVVPITVQRIIDSVLLGGGGVDVSSAVTSGAIALVAIGLAMWARRTSLARLARSSVTGLTDLRVTTFGYLHKLSMLHVQSERRGALVSRVTSDIETMQQFMEWGGVGMILGAAQITLAVVVMLVYEWRLALMIAIGVIMYSVLLMWFQRILRRAHDNVRERVADSLSVIGEATAGLPTVRAFGMESVVMGKVTRALDRQYRAEYGAGALAAVLFSSAELFAGVIEIEDPADGVALPDRPLDVSFDGVRFRYPTGDDVLTDVTVSIGAGDRVAVVGETGSGKTTFAKLATRLLDPADGTISIAGVPVDRVRFDSLRSRVSYVPQEGFLFDGTIADNVRYGNPGADDEAVREGFADLGLLDWIDSLPSGIDTLVGERGSNLSAGERQLVAVVRAWIANPDLLVLDEATSAVDPALEVQIRRAIDRLTTGRTSITVAHRLSTAEASDTVLVFDEGRLVERGTHDELVAAGGVYADLHRDWEGAVSE